MLLRAKMVAAFAAGVVVSTSAFAGAIVPVVPIVNELPRCHGCHVDQIDIGFNVEISYRNYSQVYVYSNGYVLFQGLGSLSPLWLAALDTREGGSTVTYGNLIYERHTAFAVNWVDVAPYQNRLNARNSFQLVLVDRSDTGIGNFDFIFNYDSIQWLNADAGYGNPSHVSYSVGGTSYGYWTEYGIYGSEYEGIVMQPLLDAYQLPYMSWNSDVAGRWIFEVRNGVVTNPLPPLVIPEPETWAMLLAGLGVVTGVARRRAKTTG